MKRAGIGILMTVMALTAFAATIQAQDNRTSGTTIEGMLLAHRAWSTPPSTIEITGTSTNGKQSTPIKITATADEETLIEYGSEKPIRAVSTPEAKFQENGATLNHSETPPGFSQLDITSVFFLTQLPAKGLLKTGESQRVQANIGTLDKIPVDRVRTEIHFAQIPVDDTLHVYAGTDGLLSGIVREFYPGAPFGYTLSYAFSDYRETGGVLLPYHIEVFLKGRKVETIDVTTYRVGVDAPKTLFEAGGAQR